MFMCRRKFNLPSFRFGILLVVLTVSVPLQCLAENDPEAPTLKEVIQGPEGEAKTQADDQSPAQIKKIPVKVGPTDDYERGVPRTAVAGYIQAAKDSDFERAANYLDLRYLPRGYSKTDGPELARQLNVVLDRALWIDMDILSADPKGHREDGLAAYYDLIGTIKAGDKKIDILLQRVARKDGARIWKFSSRTVRNIPALYAAHGYSEIGEKLSTLFPSERFLGLELWQWIYMGLIILAATLASFPIVRLASWLVQRKQFALSGVVSRFINGPLHVLIVIIVLRQLFDEIHPSLEARAIFKAGTIAIIISAWVILRVVDIFRDYWVHRLEQNNRAHAVVLLRPAMTAVNIFVIIIAFLVWLDNIGFSVTTVIAGLGIGGVAIALATKKSLEDFIGALTLYLATPVRVGDFCRVGGVLGVVEEIGLRATKLRTIDQTVVTFPNADFAGMPIENFAGRERFRFNPKISLRIDTSPDQIRFILLEIQKLFYAHPKVADAPRARFTGFGAHSLDIDTHCFIETGDYAEFLSITEDLNLRIMDIVHTAGTNIAIPAHIAYQDQAQQSDPEARKMAEAQVAQWREQEHLALELTQEQIDAIRNTMPYPTKLD